MQVSKNPFVVGLRSDRRTIHVEENVSELSTIEAVQLVKNLLVCIAEAKGGQDELDDVAKCVMDLKKSPAQNDA